MANIILSGNICLRERIYLSFVSKKPFYIKNIRNNFKKPGLKSFEINLFSLIDKLSSNCSIEINETGTHLKFTPGYIQDGNLIHNTDGTRALSYYLEFITYLIPLVGGKINIKIVGLRSLKADVSLETFAYVNLALLRKLWGCNLKLRVTTNILSKRKNTEVILFCPKIDLCKSFQINKRGLIIAFQVILTTSSDIMFNNENLNAFLPKKLINCGFDFKIHNFRIINREIKYRTNTMLAETSTGCILSSDLTLTRKTIKVKEFVEFYRKIFLDFLKHFISGNCIDAYNQVFFLINLINVNSKGCSEIKIKKFTLSSIYFLRESKFFIGSLFKIKFLKSSRKILVQKNLFFC
jgi:RNA 3'-terminal phosphate cyclase-like protein